MAPALSIYSFLVFMIPLSYGQQNGQQSVSSHLANTVETKPPSYSTQSLIASSTLNLYASSRPTLINRQLTSSGQIKSPNPSFTDQPTTLPSKPVFKTLTSQENTAYKALPTKQATTTKKPVVQTSVHFTSQHFKSSVFGQSVELSTSVPQVVSTAVPSETLPSKTVASTTLPSTTLQSKPVSSTTLPSTTLQSKPVSSTTLPSTTVPRTTLPSLVMKFSSPSSKSVTTTLFSTTSMEQPVSGQSSRHSAQPNPPAMETSSNHVSNGKPRPSISKVMLTSTPAITSTPAVLSQTSSEVMTKSASNHLPSSVVDRTSSKIMASSTSMPSLPSFSIQALQSSSKVMTNSASNSVAIDQTSSKFMTNSASNYVVIDQTSSKFMTNSASNSASLNLTSASRVVESMISSAVVVNQTIKERPTMIPSLSPNSTTHIMMSSTAAIESSCYVYNNSLTCTRLQPPSTMQYNSTSRGAVSTLLINSPSLTSGNRSSVATNKPTKAPGSQHEEKKHTSLIVGLAVGLSLFVVIVILIIVYYRRKRASYQYNVFYDEQNIVMHPFDYSK